MKKAREPVEEFQKDSTGINEARIMAGVYSVLQQLSIIEKRDGSFVLLVPTYAEMVQGGLCEKGPKEQTYKFRKPFSYQDAERVMTAKKEEILSNLEKKNFVKKEELDSFSTSVHEDISKTEASLIEDIDENRKNSEKALSIACVVAGAIEDTKRKDHKRFRTYCDLVERDLSFYDAGISARHFRKEGYVKDKENFRRWLYDGLEAIGALNPGVYTEKLLEEFNYGEEPE